MKKNGFSDRATANVLYRIGLAVADVLWDQFNGLPARLLLIDFSEREDKYCAVAIELPTDRRKRLTRYDAREPIAEATYPCG